MALIVEDGSGVSAAETYISVADARAYASKRGVTLPAGDPAVEVLLIKAMDFIEARESFFQGVRASSSQELAFPRAGVRLNGFVVDDDVIPPTLTNAQAQLTIDAQTVDLTPNGTGREVKRTKVDVIETEYFEGGSGSLTPQLNKAMALLTQLYSQSSTGFTISLERA